jgi:hypothetical protein
MWVTVPLVLKPRFSWLAACRLPLPDTVDWTTPCAALAVRVTLAWLLDAGPTTSTAATIAAAQRAPRMYTSQDARVRAVISFT